MPLSEHEQRLLEQIERALYADDPKFAASVRTTNLARHYRRRIIRCVIAALVGLGVMLAGIVEGGDSPHLYLIMGVGGFLIMLLASWRGMIALRRLTGRAPVPPVAARTASEPERTRTRTRVGIRERFEDRWRRRFTSPDDED